MRLMPSRIMIDLEPLRRSRDFRLLFAGQLAGVFGGQLASVAIPFQVYALTRSSLQVGAVSLAQLLPLVFGALAGGALGDAIGRRRLLIVTSPALALTSGALAVNAALARPSLLVLYLVSAVAAMLGGMVSTACNSAVPALVEARYLVAAYAVLVAFCGCFLAIALLQQREKLPLLRLPMQSADGLSDASRHRFSPRRFAQRGDQGGQISIGHPRLKLLQSFGDFFVPLPVGVDLGEGFDQFLRVPFGLEALRERRQDRRAARPSRATGHRSA